MTTSEFANRIRRMSRRNEGWCSTSVDFDEEYNPVKVAWAPSAADDPL